MEEEEKELIKKFAPRKKSSKTELCCIWLINNFCRCFGLQVSDEEEKEGLIVEEDGSYVFYDKKEKNNIWRVLDPSGVDIYSKPEISKKTLLSVRLEPQQLIEGDQSAEHPGWVLHTKGWSLWYQKNKVLLKLQIKASWWRVLSPAGLLVRNSKVSRSDHKNVVCIVPCGSKLFGEAKDDDIWLSHTDCRYPLHPSKKERKLMEKYPYQSGFSMMHSPDDIHKQYLQRSTVTVEDEKAFIERAKCQKHYEKNEPCQCCGLKQPKPKKKKKKPVEKIENVEEEEEKVDKTKVKQRRSIFKPFKKSNNNLPIETKVQMPNDLVGNIKSSAKNITSKGEKILPAVEGGTAKKTSQKTSQTASQKKKKKS